MELDFDCSGNSHTADLLLDIEDNVLIDDAFSLEDQADEPLARGKLVRKEELFNSDEISDLSGIDLD